jgi:AraC-like DNA-binding protein
MRVQWICQLLVWGLAVLGPFRAGSQPLMLTLDRVPDTLLPLAHWSRYYCDAPEAWTIRQILDAGPDIFQAPPAGGHRHLHPPGRPCWQFLTLRNRHAADTLRLLLKSRHDSDHIDLYRLAGRDTLHTRAGALVSRQRLPYPPNFMCVTFELAPGETVNCYLRIFFHHSPMIDPQGFLMGPAAEEDWRENHFKELMPRHLFFGVYFGALALLAVFSGILFGFNPREKAFAFYIGYLLAVGLFYLRNFEKYFFNSEILFAYIREWHFHLEYLLAFASYIFYLYFVDYFLELRKRQPRLSRWMRLVAVLFGGLLLLELALIPLAGITFSQVVYGHTRFLFFGLAIFFLILLVWRSRSPLVAFITAGTFMLALGGWLSALGSLPGGWLERSASGVFGSVGLRVPIYDFKVGILLESLCFFCGLCYKSWYYPAAAFAAPAAFAPPAPEIPEPERRFLAQAAKVAADRLEDPGFGPRQLAQALHLSPSQLHRKLTELSGRNATEFLRFLRIERAKTLLRETDWRIAEVALKTGFDDPAYFSRVFREETGVAPRAWRKDGDVW